MGCVSLRFATIYGPGKTLRHNAYGVVSRIIEGAARNEPVVIARGGEQKDDLIFAEDAAEGVVLALLADSLRHDEYNISTSVLHSLPEIAAAVREHFPRASIEIGPGLNFFGEGPNYSALLSNERACSDLGFRPNTDVAASVARYYEVMRRLRLAPFD
jgi:UDP-glucose 4-epimerase